MRHILLVEDDRGDVLLVYAAIRAASVDADVIIADDGEQADRLLEDNQPDLVVLDLNIPSLVAFNF
jgi:DNA-binding response OmpR family regulator